MGRGLPKLAKRESMRFSVKWGSVGKEGVLFFYYFGFSRLDTFRHNKILNIMLRIGTERAMSQSKVGQGFHPITL